MPSPTPSAAKTWPCRPRPRPYGRRCRRRRPAKRLEEPRQMYSFTYHRPATVRQAVSLLAKNEDAKLLAGGHSLIPVMKLRLAKPSAIIDLSRVEGLSGIELKGRSIVIGAMTRHGEVANSPIVQETMPALAAVPGATGVPRVRNAGRTAGSSATNDPTATRPPPA